MATIREMLRQANADGYLDDNAEAKVCQDIVLKALAESSLCRNATIKGGVVMRSISGSARRATQDIDIDFIRYSLSDDSIRRFVEKLNCLPDFQITQTGRITELKQQDYHGKRVFVAITDETGDMIESKIDLGVHKNLSVEQEEYCFDIACFEEGANLLINSPEQMFTEKLRSLLKFGTFSTRYKDIFDMCYLSDRIDPAKLLAYMDTYIFTDPGMRENTLEDVVRRVNSVFVSQRYISRFDDLLFAAAAAQIYRAVTFIHGVAFGRDALRGEEADAARGFIRVFARRFVFVVQDDGAVFRLMAEDVCLRVDIFVHVRVPVQMVRRDVRHGGDGRAFLHRVQLERR